jgi:hypothetical protein
LHMKTNGLWIAACTHPGPYRESGYKGRRWLSPCGSHEPIPIQVVMAVPVESCVESYDDLRDQLES